MEEPRRISEIIEEVRQKLFPRIKCIYCGREFYKPVAHKCRGNFRKKRMKYE